MPLLNEKDIIAIARAKLPLVVKAFNDANLEAQKAKPDLHKLKQILGHDDIDGFYDLSDILGAYEKLSVPTKEPGSE